MLPKRLTWFGLGAVTGAAGVVYGAVRAREATTVEPARVADALVGAGRRVGAGVRDVVAESRAAVREVEEELRRDQAHRRRPDLGGRGDLPLVLPVEDRGRERHDGPGAGPAVRKRRAPRGIGPRRHR
jgi:hypothetical protein